MGWPWARRNRLADDDLVVSSRQVLGGAEVVLVARMYSGIVQFVDGSEKSDEDAATVHFSDIVALDSGLERFRDLPKGKLHVRHAGTWVVVDFYSDSDFGEVMSGLG